MLQIYYVLKLTWIKLYYNNQYKNTTEATVGAVKRIVMSCERSGSVKRLIYTATVVAASPLKEDGSGFKDLMDETCWSPTNLSIPFITDFHKVTNFPSNFGGNLLWGLPHYN